MAPSIARSGGGGWAFDALSRGTAGQTTRDSHARIDDRSSGGPVSPVDRAPPGERTSALQPRLGCGDVWCRGSRAAGTQPLAQITGMHGLGVRPGEKIRRLNLGSPADEVRMADIPMQDSLRIRPARPECLLRQGWIRTGCPGSPVEPATGARPVLDVRGEVLAGTPAAYRRPAAGASGVGADDRIGKGVGVAYGFRTRNLRSHNPMLCR